MKLTEIIKYIVKKNILAGIGLKKIWSFQDYGNEATVDEANIKLCIDNIPVDDILDQFVVTDDEMLGAKPKVNI